MEYSVYLPSGKLADLDLFTEVVAPEASCLGEWNITVNGGFIAQHTGEPSSYHIARLVSNMDIVTLHMYCRLSQERA